MTQTIENMRRTIVYIGIMLSGININAQDNIQTALSSIETNNTTLKALRDTRNAEELENKTGLSLSNPEVEFGYLWGSPSAIGNRTDFSVSQTFDFPTITGMKGRVADYRNKMLESQHKVARMNILLEAKQYCIDLIYCNALKKELMVRLQHAQTIASGYQTRFDQGDISILEYNKVRLNLSVAQGEVAKIDVERKSLLAELKRLNGGMDVFLDDDRFPSVVLPIDFDDWYMRSEQINPALIYLKQEVELSKRQVKLSKSMGLPALSAGYMSEKVAGEQFQGISIGVSIPLWENRNRVKQAKAQVRAAESKQADSKRQFYDRLQIQYKRASGLKTTAEAYRKSMETANSTELLKKALDAGEISVLEYIIEIGLYYDTVNLTLEAEKEYHKAFAELSAVEL